MRGFMQQEDGMKRRYVPWGFFSRFNRTSTTVRKVAAVVTISSFFLSNIVCAAQIITDGRTPQTQVVDRGGNVFDVINPTQRGDNAYNSFSHFSVYANEVVNLHVPASATNLINLVHSERTTINGMLNSIRNNQVGGNVFFLNPHGFLLGSQGVVNVGSLSVFAPTKAYMDDFFDLGGNPSTTATTMLFNKTVPIQDGVVNGGKVGLISIQGTVNAIDGISLFGDKVVIGGSDDAGAGPNPGLLTTGAVFESHEIDFSDVVNTGDLVSGTSIEMKNGDIYIRAPEITLEKGSRLLAHVREDSAYTAGDITLEAVNEVESSTFRSPYENEGAEAKITIDGATIKGGDITITAKAGDVNSDEDSPSILENWTIEELKTIVSDSFSLPVALMVKRADATVKIDGSAAAQTEISGSGSVDISAVSSADGTVKAISGGIDPVTNNPVLNVFSVGYSKAEATAKVEVGSDVAINAQQDVSLLSDASATASVTARTSQNLGAAPSSRNNVAVSLAIAKSSTTSHAILADGSSVTAAGSIDVDARGKNVNIASAETGTYDDGLAGVAVGLGFSNADIKARVDGNLESRGSGIGVTAELEAKEVTSGVAGIRGDPLVKDALLKGEVAPFLPFILTGSLGKLRDKAGWFGGDSDWSLAGTLAYADVTNGVTAQIGGTAVLKAWQDVDVQARLTDRVQTVAETVISQQTPDPGKPDLDKAVSAAVIVGSYTNTARALIDSGAKVDAGRNLSIDSTVSYPFLTEPGLSLLPFTKEDFQSPAALGSVLDQKLGLQNLMFNSWARSVGTGGDFGISGSVDYMSFTNTSEAIIGKNARINQDSDFQAAHGTAGQSVFVNACTDMELVDMAGTFDLNLQASTLTNLQAWKHPFADWVAMGASGKKGAGGSALLMFLDNTTTARVEDGAAVSTGTSGTLSLKAETDTTNIALVQSGAKGQTFGVAGSFSYIDQQDETVAQIDSGAGVSGGAVGVSAADNALLFNATGSLMKAKEENGAESGSAQTSVGASVSVNSIERDTRALVGHAAFDPASRITGGGTIDLGYAHGYATGDEVVYRNGGGRSIAGLVDGKTYQVEVIDSTRVRLRDAGTGEVVELAAVPGMDASHMLLSAGGKISAEGGVSLSAQNTGSINAYSLAAAIASSSSKDQSKEEKSPVPDKLKKGQDDSDDPLDGISLPELFGDSKPKASISLAGDASVNLLDDETDARITGANIVKAANVDAKALSDSDISSLAGSAAWASSDPTANKTSVSLAGSVTYNRLSSRTNARIEDSSLKNVTGKVELSADTKGVVRTIAASGSVARKEGYGLAGSVAVSGIDNDTAASISRSEVEAAGKVVVATTDEAAISSIAGALASGEKAGVGASVAVNLTDNTTEAYIQDSDVTSQDDVLLSADEKSAIGTVSAAVGQAQSSFSLAGSASVSDLNNTTRTYIKGKKAQGVAADGSVSLAANDEADILSVAGNLSIKGKSVSGGGGAGLGGSASVIVTNNTVESYIGHGSVVTARGLKDAIPVRTGEKGDDGSQLMESVKGVSVTATSHEDIDSIAAGGALSDGFAVEGSATVNVLKETTRAHIDGGATVTAGAVDPDTGALTGTEQGVNVRASDSTDILGIAGAVTASVKGGMGAGADVGTIRKTTRAFIGNDPDDAGSLEGATVRATGDILVRSSSREDIDSVAGTIGLSKGWAFGGAASVYDIENTTSAHIDGEDGSLTTTRADGNILVSARDETEIDSVAAGIVGAKDAAIGASATAAVISKTTDSFIGKNAKVEANGKRDNAMNVAIFTTGGSSGADASGLNLGDAEREKIEEQAEASVVEKTVKGLAITSFSRDDVTSIAASGGGAAGAAINLAGSVNVITNNTSARIADGARINEDPASPGDSRSVLVSAGTDLRHTGVGAAAALAGKVGLGPAAEVTVVRNNTKASIGASAAVNANGDVEVLAESRQDILSIAGAGALGVGAVGLAGAVPVISIDNETSAYIAGTTDAEQATTVNADGNIVVRAKDLTRTDIVAGSVAGGTAGIGGAVGVTLIEKDTSAFIGDRAVVNAKGNSGSSASAYTTDNSGNILDAEGNFIQKEMKGLAVQAESSESFSTVAGAGAGGAAAALAGAVVVSTVESDTRAYIGDAARVNQGQTGANAVQDVNVAAVNKVDDFAVSGSLAGGTVGISGGLGFHTIKNDTTAYVGNNAKVAAEQDVQVQALSDKKAETYAVSMAGGLVGLGGGVTVLTIGDKPDDAAARSLSEQGGNPGYANPSGYAENQAKQDLLGGVLSDSYGMDEVKTAAGSATQAISAAPTAVPSGTAAFIGSSATLEAGRDVGVQAKENIDVDMTSGAGAVGWAGVGGGVGIASVRSQVKASIGENAKVSSTKTPGNVTVSAELQEKTVNRGYAGGLSAFVSASGAVAVVDNDYLVDARIEKGVTIDQAGNISVSAQTGTDDTAKSGDAAVSFLGLGGGLSWAEVDSDGTTSATVSDNARIGTAEGKTVNSLTVEAHSTNKGETNAKHLAGGIVAGGYNKSDASVNPTVTSSVGDDAKIELKQDLAVAARADVNSLAKAMGGNFGAASVGFADANAAATLRVKSFIAGGGDSDISAGGSISVRALGNCDGDGTELENKVRAENEAAGGSLIFTSEQPRANATGTWTLEAYLGEDANVHADEDVEVLAQGYTGKVESEVWGLKIGIGATMGDKLATTTVTNTVTAHVDEDAAVSGDSVTVRAEGKTYAYAQTSGGGGGIYSGASAESRVTAISSASAYLAGNKDRAAKISAGKDVDVSALSDIIFNSVGKSTDIGALVGHNGVRTTNSSTSAAVAYIGGNADVEAGEDIHVNALNRVSKPNIGVNLSAGAGGFWGGPAGDSVTTITNKAEAYIAGNSEAGESEKIEAERNVTVSAANDVSAYDKATLTAGGAIAVADVHSTLTSTNTAKVSLGGNADVQAGNDFTLTAKTKANVEAATYTEGFGVGASADGKATVSLTADNDAVIAAGSRVRAGNAIDIAAGKDADGVQNNLRARADAQAFSAGGIPLSDVEAYAYLYDYNDVLINAGSDLKAAGDINVGAFKGLASAEGYARAKMRTYALFGIPITWYSDGTRANPILSSDSVTIDGTLESGTERHQILHIDRDRNVTGDSTIGWSYDPQVDPVTELDARIAALDTAIEHAKDANEETILRMERSSLEDRKLAILAERAEANDPTLGNFDRFVIEDTRVVSGDIAITGTLTGSGLLKVPGNDFLIRVTNDSPAHLELNKLEIPEGLSGEVIVNNKAIKSHDTLQINRMGDLGKRIVVENTYDPDLPGNDENVFSDLVLKRTITNLDGSIDIINRSGSIESLGDIVGDEVNISTASTFTQNYTRGLSSWPLGEQEPVAPFITAGSIAISGEVLNIRGTIKSGEPERRIVIEEFDPETLAVGEGGRKWIPTGEGSNIRAYWDEKEGCIQLESVRVTGGNITLTGEIVSTGNGRLEVIDGYGSIEVVNHSSRDMIVNRLDTGNRISGRIKITDTGKLDAEGNPLVTEITGSNGNINVSQYRIRWDQETGRMQVVENSTADYSVEGRTTEYAPRPGARFLDLGADTVIRETDPVWGWILEPPFNLGVQADRAIDVAFTGSDASHISVTGTGTGSILLNRNIFSRDGDVSIENRGSILSFNEAAQVWARNITLSSAEGDVGTAGQAVAVDTLGGLLKASARGQINIRGTDGDLVVDEIRTRGNALITADGSILGLPGGSAGIIARDITLVSENGGIGRGDNVIRIDSLDGVLSAEAKGSIYLSEIDGAMLLNRVESAEGDVVLTADGPIRDSNYPRDDDTLEGLAGVRNDLGLDSEAKVQEAITAYRQQKKTEYQDSHRLSDSGTPFDPNDDVYDAGYDPDWEYTLTPDEEQRFAQSVWKDEDLVNAKNILSMPGNERPEEANVSGRNVTLVSNSDIGTISGQVIIDRDAIVSEEVTAEQRSLLVHAENGEASFDENGNVVISLSKDLNIQATGKVTLRADGAIHLDARSSTGQPLSFDVRGRNGALAENVDITAASGNDVQFEALYANNAAVDAAGRLTVSNALLGNHALFTNQDYTVIVSNAPLLEDADLQLYAKDLRFGLTLPVKGGALWTDAFVVNYKNDVLVNEFSTENSITRLIPKFLSVAGAQEEKEDREISGKAWAPWRSGPAAGSVVFEPGMLGVDEKDFIADEDDAVIEKE